MKKVVSKLGLVFSMVLAFSAVLAGCHHEPDEVIKTTFFKPIIELSEEKVLDGISITATATAKKTENGKEKVITNDTVFTWYLGDDELENEKGSSVVVDTTEMSGWSGICVRYSDSKGNTYTSEVKKFIVEKDLRDFIINIDKNVVKYGKDETGAKVKVEVTPVSVSSEELESAEFIFKKDGTVIEDVDFSEEKEFTLSVPENSEDNTVECVFSVEVKIGEKVFKSEESVTVKKVVPTDKSSIEASMTLVPNEVEEGKDTYFSVNPSLKLHVTLSDDSVTSEDIDVTSFKVYSYENEADNQGQEIGSFTAATGNVDISKLRVGNNIVGATVLYNGKEYKTVKQSVKCWKINGNPIYKATFAIDKTICYVGDTVTSSLKIEKTIILTDGASQKERGPVDVTDDFAGLYTLPSVDTSTSGNKSIEASTFTYEGNTIMGLPAVIPLKVYAIPVKWIAGDSTENTGIDISGLKAPESNSSTHIVFKEFNGDKVYSQCIVIAANGTFKVTPKGEGLCRIFVARNDNSKTGTVTATYGEEKTSLGTYTAKNRKSAGTQPFDIEITSELVNKEITITVDSECKLYSVHNPQ